MTPDGPAPARRSPGWRARVTVAVAAAVPLSAAVALAAGAERGAISGPAVPAWALLVAVGASTTAVAVAATARAEADGRTEVLQVRRRLRTAAAVAAAGWAGHAAAVVWAAGPSIAEGVARVRSLFFDLDFMARSLQELLTVGLRNTLYLTAGAVLIGLALGLVLALAAISRRWWVRLPALVYIDIFRGLPAIVTIFLVGTGLPLAGFRPFGRNTLQYGAAALGLIATAYMAEIFRAGIQSVDAGQTEAARSLGMTRGQATRLIVLPQGIRRVVPPLTNEIIALVKDTSLVFVLGLQASQRELFRVGENVTQQFGNTSPLVLAGLLYLVITIPLTRLTNYLDRRLREGPASMTGPAVAASGEHGG